MIEMNLLSHAAEIVSLVPLLSAVYQIRLRKNVIIKDKKLNHKEFDELSLDPIIMVLSTGTHGITPNGARQNYSVDVFNKGNDTFGVLHVTDRAEKNFTELTLNCEDQSITEASSSGTIVLDGESGRIEVMGEPTGTSGEIEIFGLLAYSPKGQPVFP